MGTSAVIRIFNCALESVLPHAMVHNHLQRKGDQLFVGAECYKLHQNVHVVGFGKAISGMYRGVQDIINDHIVKGILSVPVGTSTTLKEAGKSFLLPIADEKITVYEGAANNLPDEASHKTTLDIIQMLRNANKDDIVITLISGGGSALLCAPILPVSLQDKLNLITLLARSGASISELNTVRKAVSLVKGGGLAKLASPAKMITLILSDVIGDPLDFIASGPTVIDKCTIQDRINILKKYEILKHIPSSIRTVLEDGRDIPPNSETAAFSHVQNILVGSNVIAVNAAVAEAQSLGYDTFVLSKQIDGEARVVGQFFIDLGIFLKNLLNNDVVFNSINLDGFTSKFAENQWPWFHEIASLIKDIYDVANDKKKICLVGAGETTVHVTGHGIGGRNQEMVLAAAIHSFRTKRSCNDEASLTFLSAGTDGQDGPTDAAGAFFDSSQSFIKNENDLTNAITALENNDSYNFLKNYPDVIFKPGLTGTNVMDLQMLLLEVKR